MRLNIARTEMWRVIQDDERMLESLLAQVGNESRTAREEREKAGGFSSTCKVSQETSTTRELHLREIGTCSLCGGFLQKLRLCVSRMFR